MAKSKPFVPVEQITRTVLILRGHRVLLDADLAALYGVSTARLNQQVRRNWQRFPADFLFELTQDEYHALMLQFATSKAGRGGRRKLPLVFTEHGAIMVAAILNKARVPILSLRFASTGWLASVSSTAKAANCHQKIA